MITTTTRPLAPALAARLATPVTPDAINLDMLRALRVARRGLALALGRAHATTDVRTIEAALTEVCEVIAMAEAV